MAKTENEELSVPLRDLDPKWRSWLGKWCEEFGPDFPVVFYEDDGTGSPDIWHDRPHLAITLDWRETPDADARALAWPVDVDGWADLRDIGWQGVAEGRKTRS